VTRFFAFASRHPLIALSATGVVLAAGVLVVVASGVIPVKASSGHWPITEWFLHFAMRRSVATHALLASRPPENLDAASMVLRGAGHYETGCRPCHGTPGEPRPPIPRAMTPHPPPLGARVATWTSRELFYIVKHGVKMTGMPAWPSAGRDDEVWAVVSFLERLPQLGAAEYRRLVAGADSSLDETFGGTTTVAPPPGVVVSLCARCHGLDGGRGVGAFPTLAGQRFEYLRRALRAYADGRRHSGIMAPIVSGLTAEAVDAAARYYSSRQAAAPAGDVPADEIEQGRRIALHGVPSREIPPCSTCHALEPVNPAYPRLHGQYRDFLTQQLHLLQQRRRGGAESVHIMHTFVDRLTDEQIRAVTAYFAGTPEPPPPQ
jgi:cytochrome c553